MYACSCSSCCCCCCCWQWRSCSCFCSCTRDLHAGCSISCLSSPPRLLCANINVVTKISRQSVFLPPKLAFVPRFSTQTPAMFPALALPCCVDISDCKCEHHYNSLFKSWFYALPYNITLLYNAFSCCSTCGACKSLHAPFC